MISLSSDGETKLLSGLFNQDVSTWPNSCYVALYTVLPGKDGGGTEVDPALGYSRASVTLTTVYFSVAADQSVTTVQDIPFGTPSSLWGNVVGWALVLGGVAGVEDQLSAGVAFAQARNPQVGAPVVIPAGGIIVSSLEAA